jgi:hypothetical protein
MGIWILVTSVPVWLSEGLDVVILRASATDNSGDGGLWNVVGFESRMARPLSLKVAESGVEVTSASYRDWQT